MAIIPSDQISTLGPYAFRVTTSGAIQYGVPTMVLRLLCSGVIWAQKPKSAGKLKRGERKRHTNQQVSPKTMLTDARAVVQVTLLHRLVSVTTSVREPPAKYSMTTQSSSPTRVGGVADRPDGCATTRRVTDRLENWANTNLVKFSKGKCKALPLGRNNPRHRHRLGANRQKSSCAEKDLGVLVNIKLIMSLQSTFAARKVNNIWAALGKTLPAGQERTGERHLECWVKCLPPQYKRDLDILERVQQMSTKMIKGLEHLTYEERLRALGLCSLQKEKLRGILPMGINT
ncbi:hypothetical protein QYF61_025228 [Mycteria americana]|uniref:Uncharacterized protein n=1 Tax=Mycteria americana TaxID=33587 RepID=A0AAN7NX79_MYCAM|nr:hypothetical protein QYF61_025228 [Mycteria americana]